MNEARRRVEVEATEPRVVFRWDEIDRSREHPIDLGIELMPAEQTGDMWVVGEPAADDQRPDETCP